MSHPDDGHKKYEGKFSSVFSEKITEERIRLFCQAVGTEPSLTAPPTFLTVFRAGEFELFDQMGLNLANVLHGEQQYVYESEIHAGDEVSFQAKLTSVLEKKGGTGRMSFLSFETLVEVKTPNPRKVAKSKTTVIVREKAGA